MSIMRESMKAKFLDFARIIRRSLLCTGVVLVLAEVGCPYTSINNGVLTSDQGGLVERTGYWDGLESNLETACSGPQTTTVLVGDFNVNFNDAHAVTPLHHVLNQFNLRNHVTSPTRVTSSTATLLDLFLSTTPMFARPYIWISVTTLQYLPGCQFQQVTTWRDSICARLAVCTKWIGICLHVTWRRR